MGERSTYTFTYDSTPEAVKQDMAHVYLHWGGETHEDCEQTMRQFYEDLTAQTTDTRVDDPSYLAAKFVVWAAARSRRDGKGELNFLSVGIMSERMQAADYGVVICCGDINFGLPATYTSPDTLSMLASSYRATPFGMAAVKHAS